MENSTIVAKQHGLNVKFYVRPVQNNYKSKQEGMAVFEDVIYLQKHIPNDRTTVIDRPFREIDKKKFPVEWSHFEAEQKGKQLVTGVPLSEMGITPSMVENLKLKGFNTVEQLALAGDSNVSFMGGISLKEQANQFLKNRKDSNQEKMNDELKGQNALLKKRIEELENVVLTKKPSSDPRRRAKKK